MAGVVCGEAWWSPKEQHFCGWLVGKAGHQATSLYRQWLVPTMTGPLGVIFFLVGVGCGVCPFHHGFVFGVKTHALLEQAAIVCASLRPLGGIALEEIILLLAGSSVRTLVLSR